MEINESLIGKRADYKKMPEEFWKLLNVKNEKNSFSKRALIVEAIENLGAATRNEIICAIYNTHNVFVTPNYAATVVCHLIKQGIIERYKGQRGVFVKRKQAPTTVTNVA